MSSQSPSSQSLSASQLTIHVMLPGADTFTPLHPITYSRYVGRGADQSSFNPIPSDKRFLLVAKARVHGRDIPLDRLETWSWDWTTQSAVVLSVVAVPSSYTRVPDESLPLSASHPPVRREDLRPCFAIKFANHVHNSGPDGEGDLWYEILEREALFYQRRLRELQDVAVPTHYGMWTGTAPWGATIACSFMEWCGEQYMEDANDRRLFSIERSLKVVNAVRALHQIGYTHGDFFVDEQPRLFQHFLYDEVREKAFIIDFRRRERHDCEPVLELREYKTYVPGYLFGCSELYAMAYELGLLRRWDSGDDIKDKDVIDAMRRFEEDDDYPESGYLSPYSDTDSDPYASD